MLFLSLLYNIEFVFVLSFYKLELETEQDPIQRQWLIRQLAIAETEVLDIMRADRERLERYNHNMEIALEKIREMERRRKN
jgi:hypothetical protein